MEVHGDGVGHEGGEGGGDLCDGWWKLVLQFVVGRKMGEGIWGSGGRGKNEPGC